MEAGIPEGVARGLADKGYFSQHELGEGDVVILRVAAALDATAALFGDRSAKGDGLTKRDLAALDLAKDALSKRWTDSAMTLIILADGAVLVQNSLELMQAVAASGGVPRVLLPIGLWVDSLPTRRAWAEYQNVYSAPPLAHFGGIHSS